MGILLDHPSCERKNCIHCKDNHCALKEPERTGAFCLDFEDAMDFLRLKADAIKGTLG
jgi:hypothetical protein